jgi:hypothetical protein
LFSGCDYPYAIYVPIEEMALFKPNGYLFQIDCGEIDNRLCLTNLKNWGFVDFPSALADGINIKTE